MLPDPLTDFSELPFDAVDGELATWASHVNAAMAEYLEWVAAVDMRRADGPDDVPAYIAWRCGVTLRSAREHVRVAEALFELPLTREAFSRGEVSYEKVRALTRIATPASEEELLELAAYLTAGQLERTVAAYRRVSREEAKDVQEYAYFSYFFDDDGSCVVSGRLSPEDGAVLVKALEAARESLARRRKGAPDVWEQEPSERNTPTSAEVITTVAQLALSAAPAADNGDGDRYQVVVHVDAATLFDGQPGLCRLEEGPALNVETVRRLACDGSIVFSLESEGKTISVGRKRRLPPVAMRRALRYRDKCCAYPGCERTRHLRPHHVHHWAQGGRTSQDNLVLLCATHHRLVHEGGFRVERDGDRFRFRGPRGRLLENSPPLPPTVTAVLLETNPHVDSETLFTPGYDPLDLDLTVSAVLQIMKTATREAAATTGGSS